MDNQSCKGVKADCEGFVAGVLDELYGVTDPKPPRVIARDAGANNPSGTAARLLAWLKRYPFERAEDGTHIPITIEQVQPGDIIIVKSGRGESEGMGHVMIVGIRPNTAWHCGRAGSHVAERGIGKATALAIYRPANQERWLEAHDG